jgi:hypothetical protein
MSRRQNDVIGKVAGYVLICVVAASLVGGFGLMQAQDAIDEVLAQQQALACFQAPQMCAPEPNK